MFIYREMGSCKYIIFGSNGQCTYTSNRCEATKFKYDQAPDPNVYNDLKVLRKTIRRIDAKYRKCNYKIPRVFIAEYYRSIVQSRQPFEVGKPLLPIRPSNLSYQSYLINYF
jgi:hypothetical protein